MVLLIVTPILTIIITTEYQQVILIWFTDYSDDRVIQLLNADLADTLGNLLLRVTSHKLHPKGCVIKLHQHLFPFENTKIWSNEDCQLLEFLRNLPNVVGKYYEMYEFGRGINEIMESLYKVMCNIYFSVY